MPLEEYSSGSAIFEDKEDIQTLANLLQDPNRVFQLKTHIGIASESEYVFNLILSDVSNIDDNKDYPTTLELSTKIIHRFIVRRSPFYVDLEDMDSESNIVSLVLNGIVYPKRIDYSMFDAKLIAKNFIAILKEGGFVVNAKIKGVLIRYI